MKASRGPTLEDQIARIREEIEKIIDAQVDRVVKESPGVPPGVIRNLLTARAPACPCTQYLDLNSRNIGQR